MPDPRIGSFEARGLSIAYADWSGGSAGTLLLIHGGLDQKHSWDPLVERLAKNFRVIAPDLRGHGDSGWASASTYPVIDFVDDLRGLLTHLDCGPVTIIGHSLGGAIGVLMAALCPNRVAGVIAIESSWALEPAQLLLHERLAQWLKSCEALQAAPPAMIPDLADAMRRLRRERAFLSDSSAAALAVAATRPRADGTLAWKFDPVFRALVAAGNEQPSRLSDQDMIALWAGVAVPLLHIHGDHSWCRNPHGANFPQAIPHATWTELTGGSHWCHMEQLDQFTCLVEAFLRRNAPSDIEPSQQLERSLSK